MKPKFRCFATSALPAIIVVPAILSVARAGIIGVDPSGNVVVTSADSGPNSVLASGSDPAAPPYTVTIQSGVILTGDPVEMDGIDVSVTGYTIENLGTLDVAQYGIYTDVDGLIVNNHENAVIQGGSAGVFADTGLDLRNHGGIAGLTGAGVDALDGTVIHNYGTGSIVGASDGISIFGASGLESTVTNEGSITGTTGVGIFAAGGTVSVRVNNSGTISGNLAAIQLQGAFNEINLEQGSEVIGVIVGGDGFNTLNFTAGAVGFADDGNIVHGDVQGMDTINKDGSGFAFIGEIGNFHDVQAGSINVISGGLFINGNVDGLDGNTQITADGGELGGVDDGTGWNADIDLLNGGGIGAGSTPLVLALPPQDAVGILSINGDVTHALDSDSYVRVNIIPQTGIDPGVNSDLIVNIGSYDVGNADIRITPTDRSQVLSDGTYTIIDSDRSILGLDTSLGSVKLQLDENASVISDSVLTEYFTEVRLADGDDTNVVLDIQHDYEGLPGLTPTQTVLASVLDASINNPAPSIQEFIASLDYSDLGTVQATLTALDPSTTFGVTNSVVSGNYRLHRLTQQHLAGVRNIERITETGPSTTDAKGAEVADSTTTHSFGRGHAWGSLSYDWQNHDASANSADYDGETGAFTAGFDWRVAPRLVFGLVVDGSKGDLDGEGFGSDVDSLRTAVYGTWGAGTGFYSDFLVGYGDHSLDSTRRFPIGGSVSGDTDASSLQALWTVGYTMGDARVKYGPFAGLEYQNVDVDGFTESGLPLTMKVDGYDVDSFRALIGYRIDADLGTIRPYGLIAYAHEFEDGETNTTATFGNVPFRISGAEQSSAFLIALGAGIQLTDNLILDIGYRGEIATDDGMSSHGGSLALDYSF